MGVTGAQATVDPVVLEAAVRDVLNLTAPRFMVVLEPIKLTIRNFPHKKPLKLTVPDFPNEPERGHHEITFNEIVYIETSDFKEVYLNIFVRNFFWKFLTFIVLFKYMFVWLQIEEKGFRRLTPKQPVGLKHVGIVVTFENIEKDASGNIINITVRQDPVSENNKPKAFIHWVSSPVLASVRLYERL